MAIERLEVRARRPLADGRTFGARGTYERIDGTAHVAVDPAHHANRAIVDLDHAARGEDGRARFLADFSIVQPTDPTHGNGGLLFEVANRGRKNAMRHLNRAPSPAVPVEPIDPGDGFLMQRGWTVAWCGWQWDVVRSPVLLGLEAPQALGEDGKPLQGRVSIEFIPNSRSRDKLLADRVHRPYPAADLADPDAELTVRAWRGGPRTTIPRERWQFARDVDGRPVPDAAHIWYADGFEPGSMYEVVYRTDTCPVAGTGLLAVRDFTAFLHHGSAAEGNPCAGRIDRTIGYGVSQSGRFLRTFLWHGLNLDEAGRPVFDGLIPQVAGARRGQFNQRFAQPSDQAMPSFGHLMPFADDPQTDPLTGETGGLLDRQRALGGVPKIVTINTAAEYWRGDASLLHTDILGTHDVEPPAETRIYLFSSTQHGPGGVPLTYVNGNEGDKGAHGGNAVDYSPLTRAVLVNLDRWLTEGVEPPPSAFPRIADGTAARDADVLARFRAIPGVTVPDPERLHMIWRIQPGYRVTEGVADPPARFGDRYRNWVSAVDADGNEVAGVPMPDVSVPLATYTGWNPRAPENGGPGQINLMQGSTFPFPATRADRERTGDPRASIEERYRDRAAYLERIRAAAVALVERRYLLPEDVETAVGIAATRYDTFAPSPAGAAR